LFAKVSLYSYKQFFTIYFGPKDKKAPPNLGILGGPPHGGPCFPCYKRWIRFSYTTALKNICPSLSLSVPNWGTAFARGVFSYTISLQIVSDNQNLTLIYKHHHCNLCSLSESKFSAQQLVQIFTVNQKWASGETSSLQFSSMYWCKVCQQIRIEHCNLCSQSETVVSAQKLEQSCV
jgi:hypothetical protein